MAIKVMSWNLLWYRESLDPTRAADISTIIANAAPEVLGVQEVVGKAAAEKLHARLGVGQYSMAFGEQVAASSGGQDVALFWRNHSTAYFDSEPERVAVIPTAESDGNRNVYHVTLRARTDASERWHFFVCHLKASSGSDNVSERAREVATLRAQVCGP